MKTQNTRTVVLATIFCLALSATNASAVTYYARYPLGEPGTVGALNRPLDTSGNGYNFVNEQNGGSVTTTNSVAAPGSTTALVFPNAPASGYFTTTGSPSVQDNFDVDLWANASSVGAAQGNSDFFVTAGVAGGIRFSIFDDGFGGSNWAAHYAGVNWIGGAAGAGQPVTANAWTQLRVRAQNGTSTFFINGVAQPGSVANPVVQWGGTHVGVSPGGLTAFKGALDEVSVTQNNLLTNGGFETNSLAGWILNPQSNGKTNVGTYSGFYCCQGAVPPQGTYASNFGGGGSLDGELAQAFATIPGAVYTGSFQYTGVGDGLTDLAVTLADAITQTPLASYPVVVTPSYTGVWQTYNFSFTATSTLSAIVFTSINIGDSGSGDVMIDNVTIIPEPSALALLLIGGIGLLARRRVRK